MSTTPVLPSKRAIRPVLRRVSWYTKCSFRRPKNANFFLSKELHTYVNPRYDTSNPSWRPAAPRSRPVTPELESSDCGYECPPPSIIYRGCSDELLENIMEPSGSMMGKLEEIKELRTAMQSHLGVVARSASC